MFCNFCHSQSLRRRALRQETEKQSLSARARISLDVIVGEDRDEGVKIGDVRDVDTASDTNTLSNNNINSINNNINSINNNNNNNINNSSNSNNKYKNPTWNGGRFPFSGPGTHQSSLSDKNASPADEEEDSLVSLFKIMLTGTIPLKQARIDALIAQYKLDEVRLLQDYDGKTPKPLTAPSPPVSAALSPYSKRKSDVKPKVEGSDRGGRGDKEEGKGRGDVKDRGDRGDRGELRELRDREKTIEEQIVWCNGRCNGSANGPLCSSICIKVPLCHYHILSHDNHIIITLLPHYYQMITTFYHVIYTSLSPYYDITITL